MVNEILRRAHTIWGTTWGSILPTSKTEIEVVDAKVWSRVVTVVVDEDDEAAAAAIGDLKKSESRALTMSLLSPLVSCSPALLLFPSK